MKVGIVGGGIVGRLMAWHLCHQPIEVHLFDQGIEQNLTCSFAAGAMISPYTELAVLGKVWLEKAMMALTCWPQIIKSLPSSIYYRQSGTRLVANTEHVSLLTHALTGIQKAFPGFMRPKLLSTIKQVSCHIDDEAHLNPRQLLSALGDYVCAKGVHWHHETVHRIQPYRLYSEHQWDFDWIIDCRGLGAQTARKELRAVRGEIVLLRAPGVDLQHAVRLLHPHYACYVIPQGQHHYVVGATHLESESVQSIYVKSAMSLLTGAMMIEPRFKDAEIVSTKVGLRPTTPEHVPFVIHEPGLFQINGFFRHGFLLAPSLVADVAQSIIAGL